MPLFFMSEIKVTSVFNKNNEALKAGHDLIINQGGSRSSKTYSILQLLLLIALYSPKKKIISVVSRALPHLRLGAMRDFDNILLSFNINPDKVKNKSESYYKIGNSIIEYFGADQKDKVHGPARDILFINEANFVKYEIYEQLSIRTTGTIFIDYNPTSRFWVHDEIIPNEQHHFIKSTYQDNECIPDNIRKRIEAKKHNENWWRVYGMGEIGILEGAILYNWRYGDFDTTLSYRLGLDFGYYPDPDSFNKIAIDKKLKKIYVRELFYEYNQGTDDLITKIKHNVDRGITKKKDLIIADSASPRTIHDIKKKGYNIRRVSKTKTVSDWLREMQDYEIIITEDSYNVEKELINYLWSDKKAGVPVDDYNHAIDNIRYVFMENSKSVYFKSRQSR